MLSAALGLLVVIVLRSGGPFEFVPWVLLIIIGLILADRVVNPIRRWSRASAHRIRPSSWQTLAEKARLAEQARADIVSGVDSATWWSVDRPLPLVDGQQEDAERPVLIVVNLNTLLDATRVESVSEMIDVGPERTLSSSMRRRQILRVVVWTGATALIGWALPVIAILPAVFAVRACVLLASSLGVLPVRFRSAIASVGSVELGWLWRADRFTVEDSVLVLSHRRAAQVDGALRATFVRDDGRRRRIEFPFGWDEPALTDLLARWCDVRPGTMG